MHYLNTKEIQNHIKLYCYYSLNQINRAKDAILKKSVFCGRMDKYNDIFDGKFYPNKDNLRNCSNRDNQALKMIIAWMLENNVGNASNIFREINENYEKYELCTNAQQVVAQLTTDFGPQYDFAQYFIEIFNRQNRDGANIACHCFSEVETSLLMWSYYASGHTGLCIEYDLRTTEAKEHEAVKNLSKVNYCDRFPVNYAGGYHFFYKSNEWAHEQEWRLIIDNEVALEEYPYGEYIDFPFASAIYLGVNFPKEKKQEMRNLCKEQKIKLYQMQIVPNRYEIEPKEIVLNRQHI